MEKKIQIDVKGPNSLSGITIECYLYVDGVAHKIFMSSDSYKELIRKKFFIRDGKERDSAGVINTTNMFQEKI